MKSKHCSITHKAFHDLGPCYISRKKSLILIMPSFCQFLISLFCNVPFAEKSPSPTLPDKLVLAFSFKIPSKSSSSGKLPLTLAPSQLPFLNPSAHPMHEHLSNQLAHSKVRGHICHLYPQQLQPCLAFSKHSRNVQ